MLQAIRSTNPDRPTPVNGLSIEVGGEHKASQSRLAKGAKGESETSVRSHRRPAWQPTQSGAREKDVDHPYLNTRSLAVSRRLLMKLFLSLSSRSNLTWVRESV